MLGTSKRLTMGFSLSGAFLHEGENLGYFGASTWTSREAAKAVHLRAFDLLEAAVLDGLLTAVRAHRERYGLGVGAYEVRHRLD